MSEAQTTPATDPLVFSDTEGRPWRVKITAGDALTLRDKEGFDLIGDAAGKSIASLGEDPWRMVQIVWRLVLRQSRAIGVDYAPPDEDQVEETPPGAMVDQPEEQPTPFLLAIDGDVIAEMHRAFLEALVDFTQPAKRGPLREILARLKADEQEVIETATTHLAPGGKMTALLRKEKWKAIDAMEKQLDEMLADGPPSGSSSASPATPPGEAAR